MLQISPDGFLTAGLAFHEVTRAYSEAKGRSVVFRSIPIGSTIDLPASGGGSWNRL